MGRPGPTPASATPTPTRRAAGSDGVAATSCSASVDDAPRTPARPRDIAARVCTDRDSRVGTTSGLAPGPPRKPSAFARCRTRWTACARHSTTPSASVTTMMCCASSATRGEAGPQRARTARGDCGRRVHGDRHRPPSVRSGRRGQHPRPRSAHRSTGTTGSATLALSIALATGLRSRDERSMPRSADHAPASQTAPGHRRPDRRVAACLRDAGQPVGDQLVDLLGPLHA